MWDGGGMWGTEPSNLVGISRALELGLNPGSIAEHSCNLEEVPHLSESQFLTSKWRQNYLFYVYL